MFNYLRIFIIFLLTAIISSGVIFCSIFDRTGTILNAISRFWGRIILTTSGVRVIADGIENIQKGRTYVIISNHQSHFDVVSLFAVLPIGIRFVTKRELVKIPIFGWAMRASGNVIIDRSDHKGSMNTINESLSRVFRQRLSLLFFAEGTRSDDGSIGRFKKGGFILAINNSLPILPITIIGSRNVLKKGSSRINPGEIRLIIRPPIETTGLGVEKKDELLNEIRDRIVEDFLELKI